MDELKKLERVKIVGKGHLDPSLLSEKDWSNPDMTGWITKEGAVNRTLKKRWFVLQGNKMMYFKSNVCFSSLLNVLFNKIFFIGEYETYWTLRIERE